MSQHDNAWWTVYRELNRKKLRAYSNNYYHMNKEKNKENMRLWRLKNRDKLRIAKRENARKRRLEILSMLGDHKCVKCGYSEDYRVLQIDHVRSNGTEDRKKMAHSWSYLFWKKALIERPSDYQILCANCNWIKRYENNELERKC